MRTLLSALSGVNQLILRHNRRFCIRSNRQGNNRRTTLAKLVYTRHIYLVCGQIFQSADCVSVFLDIAGNFPELFFALLCLEIHIIGNGILHILPGHNNASELPCRIHKIRRIRRSAGLRYGLHGIAVTTAPCTVGRLDLQIILLIVSQLILHIRSNIQCIASHRYRLNFLALTFLPDGNFISGDIDAGIPAQADLLAACNGCQILRDIHLGFRYPLLHTVDELYLGDLRQITALPGSLDNQRHPLHRNLAAQKQPDIPLGIPLGLYRGLLQHQAETVLPFYGKLFLYRLLFNTVLVQIYNVHRHFCDRIVTLVADDNSVHCRSCLAAVKLELQGNRAFLRNGFAPNLLQGNTSAVSQKCLQVTLNLSPVSSRRRDNCPGNGLFHPCLHISVVVIGLGKILQIRKIYHTVTV